MGAMVRTRYVEADYLTPDKLYDFDMDDDDSDIISGHIIADTGDRIFILIEECAHIDMGDWELIHE